MSVYDILFVLRFFDNIGHSVPQMAHCSLNVAFILTLGFLLLPRRKGEPKDRVPWYDILFIIIGVAGPLYNFFFWLGNAERYAFEQYTPLEVAFVFGTILVLLEAGRRALGLAVPLVQIVFLAHMWFGSHISGPFHVHPVRVTDIVNFAYHDGGLYGSVMAIASTIIVMFMIFSQFMFATGAGDFFIKFALSLVGPVRGGPAKVAIIGSALLGTITGATMANVAATGVFTIPMMKRVGYKPEFAGAVESVASNGGQIMPPIMGLVAFVMAGWLGIPYWSICVRSFVPALLYFSSVFLMVDAEAGRMGLRGMPRSECPPLLKTINEGWLFFLPLSLLIFLLAVLQYSPQTSITYALGVLLLLSVTKWAFGAYKKGGATVQGAAQSARKVGVTALRGGATGMLIPGIACAGAGLIIGTLQATQIGIVLSDAAITVAGGNQLLLLALAALACFILGMGMSSLPVYIMVVVVVAPALLKFGVPPLLSHLFVFWWALTSFITPPVCGACFMAGAIAGANPLKVGVIATRLGVCTFTLPFMFVYRPALLLQGSTGEIIFAVIAALVGVLFLSWGLAGYALRSTNVSQRLLFLAAGIAFITLELKMVVVGVILGALALGWQIRTLRLERAAIKVPSK